MDNLICGICKGEKVLRDKITQKMEICPLCKGVGKLDKKDMNELNKKSNKKPEFLLG